MNNKQLTLRLLITSLLAIMTYPVAADLSQDLNSCSAIKVDSDRLSCYDNLLAPKQLDPLSKVSNVKEPSPVTTAKVAPAIVVLTSTSVSSQSIVQPDKASVSHIVKVSNKPANKSIDKNAIDTFGKSDRDGLQVIQSNMIGRFTSWKKGMLIHLQNGQVWKILHDVKGYRILKDPLITIEKGFFGSFDARVKGLNAKAKVRRVK